MASPGQPSAPISCESSWVSAQFGHGFNLNERVARGQGCHADAETGVLWTTAFEFASKTAMGRKPSFTSSISSAISIRLPVASSPAMRDVRCARHGAHPAHQPGVWQPGA